MAHFAFDDSKRQRYGFKNYAIADPQVIGDALEKIKLANNGRLTTEAGVTAASSTRNPLHKHLEWDDTVAGHAHRLAQMRALISSIRLVVDEPDPKDPEAETTTPAFISVADGSGRSYQTVGSVLDSEALRAQVIRAALSDAENWLRRYGKIADTLGIRGEWSTIIDALRAHAEGLKPKGKAA